MNSLLDGIDLRPRGVESALVGLNTVVARLASRKDSRAVFPDVYGIITRNVAREVRRREEGLFLEPAWISRLAGRFAERYFETLAWSLRGEAQDCAAWAIAYRAAEAGTTVPLDDAALGISAHINFDLALGLWQTIEELGDKSPERLARYKHDHDAVNALLAESLPQAVDRLEERYGCTVTPWLRGPAMMPVTREVALFVLGRWRAHVWEDVLALVHAPDEAARRAVFSRMHQRSEGLGRVLSVGSELRRLARSRWLGPVHTVLSHVRLLTASTPAPTPVPSLEADVSLTAERFTRAIAQAGFTLDPGAPRRLLHVCNHENGEAVFALCSQREAPVFLRRHDEPDVLYDTSADFRQWFSERLSRLKDELQERLTRGAPL